MALSSVFNTVQVVKICYPSDGSNNWRCECQRMRMCTLVKYPLNLSIILRANEYRKLEFNVPVLREMTNRNSITMDMKILIRYR